MASLREGIDRLTRFAPGVALNLSEAAVFLGLGPSTSGSALLEAIEALPDEMPFSKPIETGAPLGGEVSLTLRRDGSFTFKGHMHASGLPSYAYRIRVLVRGPEGQVLAASQASGEVFGSVTPGDSTSAWSEVGKADTDRAKIIRNRWPEISRCNFEVHRWSELTGVLGAGLGLLEDIATFAVTAAVVGSPAAACLFIGSELESAGTSVPGLGGVVGLCVVGGSVLIFGPSVVVPATVAGAVAGAAVDSLVNVRSLSQDEIDFAWKVFGNTLNYGAVRLTNLSGMSTRPFVAPALDGTILVNIGNAQDAPLTATFPSYPRPGQLLIHELTHVWQMQHVDAFDGYTPGLICSGLLDQALGDGYTYGSAGQAWSAYSMESQAAIVDQWFGGNRLQPGTPMDLDGPYYRYIHEHILLGET